MLRFSRVKTPNALPLAELVRRLLELHRGQWHAIADATHVSYSWVSKFAQGKIANPGYDTLNRLYQHLQKRPLLLAPDKPRPKRKRTKRKPDDLPRDAMLAQPPLAVASAE